VLHVGIRDPRYKGRKIPYTTVHSDFNDLALRIICFKLVRLVKLAGHFCGVKPDSDYSCLTRQDDFLEKEVFALASGGCGSKKSDWNGVISLCDTRALSNAFFRQFERRVTSVRNRECLLKLLASEYVTEIMLGVGNYNSRRLLLCCPRCLRNCGS